SAGILRFALHAARLLPLRLRRLFPAEKSQGRQTHPRRKARQGQAHRPPEKIRQTRETAAVQTRKSGKKATPPLTPRKQARTKRLRRSATFGDGSRAESGLGLAIAVHPENLPTFHHDSLHLRPYLPFPLRSGRRRLRRRQARRGHLFRRRTNRLARRQRPHRAAPLRLRRGPQQLRRTRL